MHNNFKNVQDRETCVQHLRADLEDREARLRAQEEEMKERDAEINRLLGELRRCQTQLLGHVQQVQNDNTVEPLSMATHLLVGLPWSPYIVGDSEIR